MVPVRGTGDRDPDLDIFTLESLDKAAFRL